MTTTQVKRLIGAAQKNKERVKNDFYATPDYAVNDILKRETFDGKVWEPACGDGAISRKLIAMGYEVLSTDLNSNGYGISGIDFLKQLTPYDNIITNPPFSLGTKFAEHGLKLAQKKFILFGKLAFLEGQERYKNVFSRKQLKTVYVYSKRVGFQGFNHGMMAFAWYVWDKSFEGDPVIKWI